MRINDYRGDLTYISAKKEAQENIPGDPFLMEVCLLSQLAQTVTACGAVKLFFNLIKSFFGYFDPKNIFTDSNNK